MIGWRTGVVRAIPGKGGKLGMIQIELFAGTPRAVERYWVPSENVNQLGDFIYHGRSAVEIYEERQDKKAEQQAKADKKKRLSPGRFAR